MKCSECKAHIPKKEIYTDFYYCKKCDRNYAMIDKIEPWISVKDRLPEIKDKTSPSSESDYVLVLDYDGIMYVGYMNFYGISGYRKEEEYSWSDLSTGCGCCSQRLRPTHWMPLPNPPEIK